jgi:hypothetical protein
MFKRKNGVYTENPTLPIMSSQRNVNSLKRILKKSILILCYFPISFSLIGILAYQMRTPSPVEGSYHFTDVFLYYANPFNSNFSDIHLPALIFSLAFLLLMVTLVDSPKPIITLTQIRILLLILIVLITIIIMIILASGLLSYINRYFFMTLFMYVDVHLILLYLFTHLPFFRKLKTTLV